MKKLNGWTRIGIIASFVWMIGGPLWFTYRANDKTNAAFIKIAVDTEFECLKYSGLRGGEHTSTAIWDSDRAKCKATLDDFAASLTSPSAMSALNKEAAIVAFVPIPFAWGFIFLVLALARWVKRGFATTAQGAPR